MFSAILSVDGYGAHALSGSLYILVAAVAMSYASVASLSAAMDRSLAAASVTGGGAHPSIISALARNRRFWVPPLYVLALLVVVAVTPKSGANAAQLMYRNF